ncbi:MAG: hypothetical protein K8I30_02300 [Anaerolineae bacterium]|nr:hypothetical protein [Anaerolineae bacterium]
MIKWITRIGIALILCLSSVVVFAQDAAPTVPDISLFCGDLAEADCELLQKSADVMKELSSATFDFDVQLSITEDADSEPQTLGLTGSGSFSGHPADMGMDMMAEGANPAAMFGAMTDALKDFSGDLTLALTLPEKVLEEIPSSKGNLPETINLELRLVDGVGYINTETLKPVLEAMGQKVPPTLKGWIGLDVVELLTKMIAENPEMLSQMGKGMMQPQDNVMFTDPTAFVNAVKIERNENSDGAAIFTITFDFASLAADPAFADMIRAQAEKQGETITEAELQKGLDVIAKAGDAIQFTATETIDLETAHIRSMTLSLVLDGSKLPQEDDDSSDMADVNVSFTATVNIDNFNDAPEITAPEDAIVLPPEMLEGMGAGMMGGAMGGSGSSPANPAEATPEATPAS